MAISALAVGAFTGALLRRWIVGSVGALVGIILTLVGFGIAFSCYQ